jgi:hypothetical protein
MKRIKTDLHHLHPTPSAALGRIAFCSAQSQPSSARVNTRTLHHLTCLAQGLSQSLNMQATMSPVPIPMLPHSAGAPTTMATRNTLSNFGVPLLRQSLTASLHAPSSQRLARHATAPEPRAYTPHPSRRKRKASFHELSPEVAERPSKRPKIEHTASGTVAIHVAVGGSSRN